MGVFNIGDNAIIITANKNYGKMCKVIQQGSPLNGLSVKVRLINPHDPFGYDESGAGITEDWMFYWDLKKINYQ